MTCWVSRSKLFPKLDFAENWNSIDILSYVIHEHVAFKFVFALFLLGLSQSFSRITLYVQLIWIVSLSVAGKTNFLACSASLHGLTKRYAKVETTKLHRTQVSLKSDVLKYLVTWQGPYGPCQVKRCRFPYLRLFRFSVSSKVTSCMTQMTSWKFSMQPITPCKSWNMALQMAQK